MVNSMKRFIKYLILIILTIIVGRYLNKHYLRPYLSNKLIHFEHNPFASKYPFSPNKPILRVRIINFDPGYAPDEVEMNIIQEVIREKYNVQYVDKDYDVLFTGYFDHITIPT